MHTWWRRVFGRVLLVHIGVVTICLLFSFLKGCFKPRPKPEILTFIEFTKASTYDSCCKKCHERKNTGKKK